MGRRMGAMRSRRGARARHAGHAAARSPTQAPTDLADRSAARRGHPIHAVPSRIERGHHLEGRRKVVPDAPLRRVPSPSFRTRCCEGPAPPPLPCSVIPASGARPESLFLGEPVRPAALPRRRPTCPRSMRPTAPPATGPASPRSPTKRGSSSPSPPTPACAGRPRGREDGTPKPAAS